MNCSVQSRWYIPPWVPDLFHSPEPVGVWGWGLQAPWLPHSPAWHSEGTLAWSVPLTCPLRISTRESNACSGAGAYGAGAPGCARSPGAERVPAAGKRLTRSSYSKHFVWGLCPGGSAFQGRGWDQGAGLRLGFLNGWTWLPAP